MAKNHLYRNPLTRRRKPARSRWRGIAKAIGIIGLALVVGVFASILLLRWVPVPTSAFMLSHHWGGSQPEYRWVPWQEIAPTMPIAVVASEDQRFLDHWGFDFDAIGQALTENRWRARPRGASTISQQVAKNLFLWPKPSWVRKGLEAGFTVAIEVCWSKRRILEVYLNIAQFGPRTFGVDAASRRYFDIPPSRLDGRQAALLAAVLPNPANYSLTPPSPYVRQRADDIQQQVGLLGGPQFLATLYR